MEEIHATEVFLVDREKRRVWLGRNKRGPFAGKIFGFGGKRTKDETIIQCATRETEEETGCVIDLTHLQNIGIMRTYRPSGRFAVHLFVATKWSGTPVETDEVRPIRCALDGAYPSRIPNEVRMILDAIAHSHTNIRMTVHETNEGDVIAFTSRRTR